jgi:hypothetical protein
MKSWFIKIVGVLVFMLSFMIGMIIYQSAIPTHPPIKDNLISYNVTKTSEFIMVEVSVDAIVESSFSAKLSRLLVHESGYQLEIQAVDVNYSEGANDVHRIFYLPKNMRPGKYCVSTILEWRPMFSLTDKINTIDQGCFEL